MTGWGFSLHPIKEIKNTNTTNVVIDVCQFDDKLPACLSLFILTSNKLFKGAPRLPRLSINFALFYWFCNGKPGRWKLWISCLGPRIEKARWMGGGTGA
jgi:hypothetical protein